VIIVFRAEFIKLSLILFYLDDLYRKEKFEAPGEGCSRLIPLSPKVAMELSTQTAVTCTVNVRLVLDIGWICL